MTIRAPTAAAAITARIVDEPLEPDEVDWVGLADVKTCLTFACEMENGRVAVNALTPGTRNVIAAR